MTLNYPLLWNPEDDEQLSEEELEALQARLLTSGLLPNPDDVDPEACPELYRLLHSLKSEDKE